MCVILIKASGKGEWYLLKRSSLAMAFVANTMYNENYVATAMKHSWNETGTGLMVSYAWKSKGKWQHIRVVAEKALQEMPAGHEIEFITEHYWGYARCSDVETNEYEVKHPRWGHYPVTDFDIDVDFGLNYGERFAFLNQERPVSVMLAEGSEVSVESKTRLLL